MNSILQAAYLPGAIGMLCAQHAFLDRGEGLKTRVVSGVMAAALSPFIVVSCCLLPLMKMTSK